MFLQRRRREVHYYFKVSFGVDYIHVFLVEGTQHVQIIRAI